MNGHPDPQQCCLKCYGEHRGTLMWMDRMICCRVCGNKRCPKATYHGNECNGSNEPGQPGSIY